VGATEKSVTEPKTYTEDEYNALVAEREALKANRDEILTEAKKAKKALDGYAGVDPKKYQELVAAAEEAERKKATAEGDFKALEKQLIERHQAELGDRDKRISKFQSALEKRAIRAPAGVNQGQGFPRRDGPPCRARNALREDEGDGR
jgi:hypothetical protein